MTSSFKPDLFMAKYPVHARPDLYKAVPDQDRIKAALSADEQAAFRAANKPSVKLV